MSSEIFVLVPSYNHASFIGRCLKSIINQSLSPKKLLVVDDGSKDDSRKIIENVFRDCPFETELIARENRGLCATLNQGFSLSSGKYFAYLGSDDIWLPDFLKKRAELLDRRESAVLGYGHAFFIDENSVIFDSTADYSENWANYPDGDAFPMLLRGIAPVSSTVFYRRSALEKVSWNIDSRLEDYEMYIKLAALGDFAFDPSILSTWRHHGYNTSKDKALMLNEVIEAQNRNSGLLSVSAAELKRIQQETRFMYARTFLQTGDKNEALKLAAGSWRGAKSGLEITKFILRMFVPMAGINAKRRLTRDSKTKRFGNITLD